MSLLNAKKLMRLALLAAGSKGVTLDDISNEFGCHNRSAQRWVTALQEVFPAVQRSTDDDRKARWVLPSRAVASLLTPSAEELTALSESIRGLEHAGLISEAAIVRQLEAKVRALIPTAASARLAVDEEALALALGHAVRPGPKIAADRMIDEALYRALKGPFRVRFHYRRHEDQVAKERVVEPHGLLLGVRRYLVARDASKPTEGMRHYRLEDISKAEVLDESFELDPEFNIEQHGTRGFGSFVDDREFGEVVWKFSPKAAGRARRFEFHPTQTFQTLKDGSVVVRFRASGFLEMCWHLYSWGDAVEVIEPLTLRTMVEHHRRDDFAALP